MEFQVSYLALFLLFSVIIDGFMQFWMASLHKNIQLMLEFLKAPFFVLHILLYINGLPDDVTCDIAFYADDTTLYSKWDQASDLWQQLELASELESDLWDTVDWGKKWTVDFSDRKTQLVLFDWFYYLTFVIIHLYYFMWFRLYGQAVQTYGHFKDFSCWIWGHNVIWSIFKVYSFKSIPWKCSKFKKSFF